MKRVCPKCGAALPLLDMAGICLRCGSTECVQLHHMLARAADGTYVQPEILVPLCQPGCHQAGIHHVLGVAGLGDPTQATQGVVLGRIALNLGWLVWNRPDSVTLPGYLVADVADVLGGIGRQLRRSERSLR